MKKTISFLLVFAIIWSYIPLYQTDVYAETRPITSAKHSEVEVKKYVRDLLYNRVPSSIRVHGFLLKFNVDLHKEKGLLVYGDYSDVFRLEGKNDFVILDGGYYTNGDRGEYRNHGYTEGGILYFSNDFPRDSDSRRSVSEKEWIYNYWVDQKEEPSDITQDSTRVSNPDYDELRSKIDDMIKDVLKNSTYDLAPKDHEQQGYAVADHMNINSLNSTLFNGEGKMMQKNAGRLWYQMFSTEKASGKDSKDQNITVEILEKGSYRVDESGQVLVKVKVTGTYKDKDITSDADRVLYYHRPEMKGIHLSLKIGSKTLFHLSQPNTIISGNSALEHTFKMSIDEGDIKAGGILAIGTSHTVFYTATEATNTPVEASDMDTIAGGLKSLFDVKDVALDLLPFEESMLDYRDYSRGDITHYKMVVTNNSTSRAETFIYGGSAEGFVSDLFTFVDGDKEYTSYTIVQTVSNTHGEDTYVDVFTFRKEIKQAIELDFDIPHHVIDIDPVEAVDKTHYGGVSVQSKQIKIDGVKVNWDMFFSGQYFFGPINSNYMALIEIKVTSENGVVSTYRDAFNVHSSLPRSKLHAEGHFKENRKVSLYNRSSDVEDFFVTAKYPNQYEIVYSVVDGSMADWKMKTIDKNHIDMLFKHAGFYKATITASNGTSRTSSTDYHIGIVPDFEPNVYFNIWNNVLTRNERLNLTYSADSLDGDTISSNNFKIYFDEDEDGIAEKLLFETTDPQMSYSPTKLGFYKIVNHLEETFGQETMLEFISQADLKKKTIERVFYVDNLRPLVEIDLDIPDNFQKVDMYIMSDESLDDLNINKLRQGRIDYNNDLRLFGLDVQADYRDLKTYSQSQAINTSTYTGGSYPPSTIVYSASGFTGTLTRYNVNNNSYQDYYTSSRSYESCRTINVFNGYVNCNSRCLRSCKEFSMFGGRDCDRGCCEKDYTKKESCTTKTTTVRHYYTVNRYTGYYRGRVYKSVKQPYTNPFRETSDKYVIYVADSTFNLADLNILKSLADFKVILIGNEALRDRVRDEMFFIKNEGGDMHGLMRQATDFIGGEYPFSSKYLVEVNDTFTLSQIMFDSEGDPLNNHGYQYVQEEVYDNKMGLESFARSTYIESSSGFSSHQTSSFSKVGLFKIYALLKDNTGQIAYDKNSNVSEISVLVHRKPIADYTLDWTYDKTTSKYRVRFVDKSYDLDHQYSDDNRGIIDHKAMYRLQGDSRWLYLIPEVLSKGTYEFRYSVKDLENAWSDPKITIFTLTDLPPPQVLHALLKPSDPVFDIKKIPASEKLTFYNIITRFPYDHQLTYRMLKNSIEVKPYQQMIVNKSTKGDDTFWHTFEFDVDKSLSDGPYEVELKVSDKNDAGNYVKKLFPIGVKTPIDLVTASPDMILPGNNLFSCTTSQYVDRVKLTLYKDTLNEKQVLMVRIDDTTWGFDDAFEEFISDGFYKFHYEALVDSLPIQSESHEDIVEKISLRASSITIKGGWHYWNGQNNIFGEPLADEPHRFLSLEEITILVETIGLPDSIEISMSSDLTAMTYTDKSNNVYRYKDIVGYEVVFPIEMVSGDRTSWSKKYILPLAPTSKSFDDLVVYKAYFIKIKLIKDGRSVEYIVDDIHITGNTLDHLYLQPKNKE